MRGASFSRCARVLPLFLAAALLPLVASAQPTAVAGKISKVGVKRVIRVEIDPSGPKDGKTQRVRFLMQAGFPKCTNGSVWFYKEGDLDDAHYYSFWSAEQAACAKASTRDLVHTMDLPVGKKHTFVFRGPGRFDQRVSFKLDPGKVSSMFIKKMIAH